MVENTAGKLWLDHKPNSPLKDQMKYLVNSSEEQGTRDETNPSSLTTNPSLSPNHSPLITNVEDLSLIDPACGSGHILVEGFELLYQMYLEEYYTPEEAVQTIFEKNLYGLDIDERATQLATFAVLLKAAKVYPDVWDKNWQLNIYAMPEANSFSQQEVADFLGEEGKEHIEALEKALQLMQQAKNLGSVMQLDISEEAVSFIVQRYQAIKQEDFLDFNLTALLPKLDAYIPVLVTLSRKFTAVVANPPYMVSGNMNQTLKLYLQTKYPLTKGDLNTVFMEVCWRLTIHSGKYSMVNQTSWLFKNSYLKFRKYISKIYNVSSLLHLGPRLFDELSGEVVQSTAYIVTKDFNTNQFGFYYNLVEPKTSELKLKSFFRKKSNPYFFKIEKLSVIPDFIFAYWLSDKGLKVFDKGESLSDLGEVKKGVATGDDSQFLREWFEIVYSKIYFNSKPNTCSLHYNWLPVNKGGGYRKWSGNFSNIINWHKDGLAIKNFRNDKGKLRSRPQNLDYSFKDGITYNIVSSKGFTGRFTDYPSMMCDVGPTIFELQNKAYILGILNSVVASYFFSALCPGYKYDTGAVGKLPVISQVDTIPTKLVENSVKISKKDWDSRETSWDFEQSPLLVSDEGLGMRDENSSLSTRPSSLSEAYERWEKDVTQDFFQLHQNEEELNRIFIDIYGLQDELTPEVALKDITILQDELDRKQLEQDEEVLRDEGLGISRKDKGLSLIPENYSLPIDKAEVMQQFISYAIGLFMGRYRLDKPGLNIAHPNPSEEELTSYNYKDGKVTIDDDAIIPLMGTAANFKDDALYQIQELLDTIWGKDTRTENLNFLQDGLNKDLEKYLVKDFWKYHCKTYKKKPIYWLFSSKKGAFQVLVYMHRMNAFTVEKIRANYLLEHLKYLNAEITALENNEANLNTQQARKLDQLRKDLVECEEYDMHLKNAADAQITFDLDDGVTENYKLFTDVVAKIK